MPDIKTRNGGNHEIFGLRSCYKMSELFKCLILSCVVSAVFGFTNVRDDVAWFKNGQRIKNRWAVNGIVDLDCQDTTKNGGHVEGECMSKLECGKAGGKIGGLCSLLGSCCVMEKTCNQTTSSKLSYFVPPDKFQTDCALNVKVFSKDVCQIRLDFEKFDIAQPTSKEIKSDDEVTGYSSFQCHTDRFLVENSQKNLGFLHLCGQNKGQHIYIPIGEKKQDIVLRFVLKNRTSEPNLGNTDWRIKIRQLECRKNLYDHLDAPSKLMALYNTLKNKKSGKSDYDLIAPPNCLQYYPEKTGKFESFNYNEGKGPYIGQLNYAVCFRKTPDICEARYTADDFQMNQNKFEGTEDDMCHPKKQASTKVSQDYIRIPGGVNSQNYFRDYYCDKNLSANDTVVATSFEPLYVGVHTDGFRPNANNTVDDDSNEDFQELGFRIQYELNTGDCYNPY